MQLGQYWSCSGCTQFVSIVNTNRPLAHNSRSLLEQAWILLYYTHYTQQFGPNLFNAFLWRHSTWYHKVPLVLYVHMNRDLTSRKCTHLMTQSRNYNTVANINNNDDMNIIPAMLDTEIPDGDRQERLVLCKTGVDVVSMLTAREKVGCQQGVMLVSSYSGNMHRFIGEWMNGIWKLHGRPADGRTDGQTGIKSIDIAIQTCIRNISIRNIPELSPRFSCIYC